MENARDTFYIALRNRLSALNPNRTMLLRGVRRPGILIEANESVTAHPPADVFVLRWSGLAVDGERAMPLAQQVCEIAYATEGTVTFGGMDRGRALAAMDAEIAAMLQPTSTQKFNYAQTPAVAMTTNVFWTAPEFGEAVALRDRMSRTVKVTVFSYEEAGEA